MVNRKFNVNEYKGVNNIADFKDRYRKTIKGSSLREMEARVLKAEIEGWVKVGKMTVDHGAYRSYYYQVMDKQKETNNG